MAGPFARGRRPSRRRPITQIDGPPADHAELARLLDTAVVCNDSTVTTGTSSVTPRRRPWSRERVEVRGDDGTPPYVVRWSDSDHEVLFLPGPDASVHHLGADAEPSA